MFDFISKHIFDYYKYLIIYKIIFYNIIILIIGFELIYYNHNRIIRFLF